MGAGGDPYELPDDEPASSSGAPNPPPKSGKLKLKKLLGLKEEDGAEVEAEELEELEELEEPPKKS